MNNLRHQCLILLFGILLVEDAVLHFLDAEASEALTAPVCIVAIEKVVTLICQIRKTRIFEIARRFAFVQVARE